MSRALWKKWRKARGIALVVLAVWVVFGKPATATIILKPKGAQSLPLRLKALCTASDGMWIGTRTGIFFVPQASLEAME